MRNLVYGINLTLDGCCDHAKIGGSEEILDYVMQGMSDIDLIIYGRKTYELMVPYWPDVEKNESSTNARYDFARIFNAIEKIVFSRSAESLEGNPKIIRGDLKEEILKLKQQPGKNISVGGVDLPLQLIALGLVDEFRIIIHPKMVGEGRRLVEGSSLQEQLNLKLVESKIFESGRMALHYIKE